MEVATLGAGCFWCVEAIFRELKGVDSVVSGYSGGTVENPNSDQVYSDTPGHAEVAQITFDPKIIRYKQILDVFWATHDPTSINKQGNDVGSQYRSVIFYHNDKQKRVAEESKKEIEKEELYKDPIVTEIVPFEHFYPAENYHQRYYEKNSDKPYCQYVINPKIQKFREKFNALRKKV